MACRDDSPSAARRDGGHDPNRDDASTAGDAGPDDKPVRHFQLATAGTQLLVKGPRVGLQLTAANVTEDSDVVAIHQEFYGVPWDAFENDAAPPPEWVAMMEELARSARDADKPVFLSLSMLNGARESLAARTVIENGAVKSQDNWSAKCYDFAKAGDRAEKRAAYLRYVKFMVDTFAPTHLNVAIEVNLFFEKCEAATPGLIELINDVYDQVKAETPKVLVFPSFQIDHLLGYSQDSCPNPAQRDDCFDAAYAVIEPIERDRFAMSSYPYLAGFNAPSDLPADWFTRAAQRGNETPLIAETGWPSTEILVRARDNSCPTYFSFDEATSAAYLERVLSDAEEGELELVTWWSDRDLLPAELMTDCPCDFDAVWCSVLDDVVRGPATGGGVDTQLLSELLFKVFGTMGLRSYDGTPKKMHFQLWDAARARPYEP